MMFFSGFSRLKAKIFSCFSLLFFLSFFLMAARENKTKYIPPGKEKILQILADYQKKADSAPEKDFLCIKQILSIEIYMDHSCKIAASKEFFLKKEYKEDPFPQIKKDFVEQYFPGGVYKSSHDPKKLFLPANSVLILKSSYFLPPKKAEEFFLELFLDHPYRVLENRLTIAYTRNQKLYHALIPPYGGRLPLIRKFRKNTYILKDIPAKKDGENDERLRFYVSAIPSWRLLGNILLSGMEKKNKLLPPLPEMKKELSPYKKALFLYQEAKKLFPGTREYILYKWLNEAGIKANMAAARDTKSIPMGIACNFFTRTLVCIREQKGFHSVLFLDLSAEEMGKTTLKNNRFAVLILEKDSSFILFENQKK
ncbi:MAG: hypothetical protein J6S53_03110 [Lentisphaeria bacterium]|nr:hypothetical protein [Lentisphaeria bacterium]